MDEEEIIGRMIGGAPHVTPALAGAYLGRTDHTVAGEIYGMVAELWARNRGCLRIEPGRSFAILPDLHRAWTTGVLVAVIPLNPDQPEPQIDDAFGLWQLRDIGHPARWALLDDRWLSAYTLRPGQ